MEIPLLRDVVIILVLAMGVVYLSQRLKLPTIVGLLTTGVLAGPHALGLVRAIHEVEQLAKIGVILLLFTIGIEFSLRKLLKIKTIVLIGGSLQVAATVGAAFAFTRWGLGWPPGEAIFMGFLVSLSSTAIVLKVLQDRAEMESGHGRMALGILIFQDVIVVLFIILTPFLAGQKGSDAPVLRLALTGVALIVFVFAGSRYLVPAILHQTIRTRSRELFLLTIGGICFAVAFAASELSLALGAFLAGLTISESEYSHEAFELMRPFRDIFTSFFFVSIGMLLDIRFILEQPVLVFLATAGVLIVKSLVVAVTGILLGYPLRTAIISGLSLSQVGEFAFILATVGSAYGLIADDASQMFLAVSVLTMAGTSFLITGAPAMADRILKGPVPERLRQGIYPVRDLDPPSAAHLRDHLVIIGFGINGRNVARAARYAGIAYIVIEMNADTVRTERKQGEPILYGDAIHEAVLDKANLKQARTVVITIADAASVRRVAELLRQMNPRAHIIARTRFVGEMEALDRLCVNEVIPEEFETSVEIFSRVLKRYLVPHSEIARLVAEIRGDGYQVFRKLSSPRAMSVADLSVHMSNVEIATFPVSPASAMGGKTLAALDLRKRTGLTVLAIRRGETLLPNPEAETRIMGNDVLYVIGRPEQVAEAFETLT